MLLAEGVGEAAAAGALLVAAALVELPDAVERVVVVVAVC